MRKIAILLSGFGLLVGAIVAAPNERDEQDAIALSLAKEHPRPSPAFVIDPQTGTVTQQTPLSRYLLGVRKAVGARWAAYVTPTKTTFLAQSTKVAFKVSRDGIISDVTIREVGSSTKEFRTLCITAVNDTKLPPMSAGVDTGGAASIEISYPFRIFQKE